MILADNETKVDLLNNEPIAATVVQLLRNCPDTPVTIGIHGDWGAGKSSVLEMIEAALDNHKEILCLKFSGWRFQGFEDAKIALIEGIVTGLIDKRPALKKTSDAVKSIFRRIDWLKIAKRAGGLAFTAYTGIPSADQIQAVVFRAQDFLSDPDRAESEASGVIDELRSLLKPETETKNVPEEVAEFRKDFERLLTEAKVDQLIVLIDDLDRCLPDTAIETLEAIRLFLFTSRTAFVVAADEAMIEYAVRKHFPDFPNPSGPQTYARNYLEKLIQVPFRIPALGETETRIYVTLLLIGNEIGEDDPDFEQLIAKAREVLKRPWKGTGLDAGTISTVLGTKYGRIQTALILSDQIGPILARGTKGNPRQIKRFLNTLVLRQKTAEARGFGEDIKLPVLAKLLLAERFLPELFSRIASNAATAQDGIYPELQKIESETYEGARHIEIDVGERPTPSSISIQSNELDTSREVKLWATLQPPIFNVDLRPYLFAAKEKKDFFGAVSSYGHLATIAERLFGPKFSVLSLQEELQQLTKSDAAQMFETVRSRIMGNGHFDTQPDGIEGLSVLVKAHPHLQSNLLDFLENLPISRIGTWVVQGWVGAIVEPNAEQRYEKLLTSWSQQEENKLLKTSAISVMKINKARGKR